MSVRVLCWVIVPGGLLLAAVLSLSVGFGQPGPEPPAPASELALLPGDCAVFLSVRLAELARDRLTQGFTEGARLLPNVDRGTGLSPADVERYTAATLAGETVEIIRTRQAVETRKLLAGLDRRSGFKDKMIKDGFAKQEEPSEKKIAGKTVYYQGQPNRWTTAVCVLERKVFVRGNLTALEALLGRKARQSPELKAMLAEARKHTLVAGFQGKEFREMLRREFRRFETDVKDRAVPRVKPGDKEEKVVPVPPEMLPYKPLALASTALVTLDVDEGYRASGRVVFPDKETADEGEHAAKTVLYVLRELLATAPQMERGLRPLAPLVAPVEKAFRSARIVRKGNTLETSVRLSVSQDTSKKIADDLVAERKRREEEMSKYRFKDKDIRKDGFKDKK
jgi:hypothetical protein